MGTDHEGARGRVNWGRRQRRSRGAPSRQLAHRHATPTPAHTRTSGPRRMLMSATWSSRRGPRQQLVPLVGRCTAATTRW
ncbi:hypothetical protein QJS66_10605 [Kocuria rhizophila]|nr:hypothetical protein QJS66_10605 [Kocuria rhizophila]